MRTGIKNILSDTRLSLGLILFLAIALRTALALLCDNFNHPDENFQIMEQAHRLLYGYGIIPWEFRHAARSWILPGLVSLNLLPFKLMGINNPDIYIPGVKILLSLHSLLAVYAAYLIGKRLASPKAGLWAAFLCAVWFEIIYFSIRPLSEVRAATYFMLALSLSGEKESVWKNIVAGYAAVMTAAIRINYLPLALLLLAVNIYQIRDRARRAFWVTAIATLLLVGCIDWITLGKPFISYINFISFDRSFFMAGGIGSAFSFEYIKELFFASSGIYWIILLLGVAAWNKTRLLLLFASTALLTHFLIPAKIHQTDYRHIYVLIPLLMTMAGVAIPELAQKIAALRLHMPIQVASLSLFVAVSIAGSCSALPYQNRVYKGKIFDAYDQEIFQKNDRLRAYRYLHSLPHLTGVYDLSDFWFRSGGYYYLHRKIPLYFANKPPSELACVSHIIAKEAPPLSLGFRLLKSFGEYKIYERTDPGFICAADRNYSYDMLQKDIDDRLGMAVNASPVGARAVANDYSAQAKASLRLPIK